MKRNDPLFAPVVPFAVGDRVIVRATGDAGTIDGLDENGAHLALDNGGRCGIAANDVALERVPATFLASETLSALRTAGIDASLDDTGGGIQTIRAGRRDENDESDVEIGPFGEDGVAYSNDLNMMHREDALADGPVIRYVESVEAVVAFALSHAAPSPVKRARSHEAVLRAILAGDFPSVLDEDVHAEILAAIRNVLK